MQKKSPSRARNEVQWSETVASRASATIESLSHRFLLLPEALEGNNNMELEGNNKFNKTVKK